ncbi:hypothetical protein MTR67_004139 [Solanum verrucosum]|uniref:Uncharacterized protein n=1 Tax=Solanum verrucosum TaxID=315347 RepID=A0AAF0PTE1_SOLVR|nr:hypothetical protein MTR67_004139 [Solanum verrucosum]
MTVTTKLVVFFAILSLFRVFSAQALKECPFKSLYQQFQNSISINHFNNYNNTMLVTRPHDPDFFAQHQWLKNHIITLPPQEKRTGNSDYNNRDFYDKFIEAIGTYLIARQGFYLFQILIHFDFRFFNSEIPYQTNSIHFDSLFLIRFFRIIKVQ